MLLDCLPTIRAQKLVLENPEHVGALDAEGIRELVYDLTGSVDQARHCAQERQLQRMREAQDRESPNLGF